jgi:hypothetical protein
MCCCCKNPATAFGVVGGIVINFAFAGLIAFCAATFWPLGFIISFFYTGLLFYLSMYIRKKYKETVEGAAVVADILVMVGVFAFAVTTLFLPWNLIATAETRNLAVLFITSIPTLLLAVAIAVKFQISSMAVPLFFFTSTAVVNIYSIIDPAVPEMSNLLKWWTTLFSSFWLIVALVLFLTNRVLTSKYSAAWYMNVGGLMYFGAIHAQLLVPAYGESGYITDDTGSWVLYQFLLVIPLALYAITCDKTLFLLLSSGGIIVDVWRLSTFITNLTTNTTAQTLIRFCILASTGVGIVYVGFLYQQNASMLQEKVVKWSQTYLICRKDEVGDGNKDGIPMADLADVTGSDVENLLSEDA